MGLDNKVPEELEPDKEDYSFMKESIKDEKKDKKICSETGCTCRERIDLRVGSLH